MMLAAQGAEGDHSVAGPCWKWTASSSMEWGKARGEGVVDQGRASARSRKSSKRLGLGGFVCEQRKRRFEREVVGSFVSSKRSGGGGKSSERLCFLL